MLCIFLFDLLSNLHILFWLKCHSNLINNDTTSTHLYDDNAICAFIIINLISKAGSRLSFKSIIDLLFEIKWFTLWLINMLLNFKQRLSLTFFLVNHGWVKLIKLTAFYTIKLTCTMYLFKKPNDWANLKLLKRTSIVIKINISICLSLFICWDQFYLFDHN